MMALLLTDKESKFQVALIYRSKFLFIFLNKNGKSEDAFAILIVSFKSFTIYQAQAISFPKGIN